MLLPTADVCGTLVNVSSIGAGSYGQPSISIASRWGHLTFGYENGRGGPKATLLGSTLSLFNKTTMSTTQPLIEDNLSNNLDTGGIEGETILSGFCNTLSELVLRENGVLLPPMIGSVAAIPGAGFPNPTSGVRYQNIKDHVLQQQLVSGKQSYALRFMLMGMGADEPALTDAQFRTSVETTLDDLDPWVMATTGQTAPPHYLFTTAAYPSSYSIGGHPQAVLNVCLERDNCWIGTPDYPFEMSPIDPPHHTALGYNLVGANMAPVAKTLLDGATPKPMRPLSAILQGSTLYARFSKRVFPVILDATSLNVANSGFRVSFDGGVCTLGPCTIAPDGLAVLIPITSTPPTAQQNPVLDTVSQPGLRNCQGCSLHDGDKRTVLIGGISRNLWTWCTPFTGFPITVIG